ncbi:Zn-ribbon domain-containing OB-fold protein [Roseovarius indicus]|uniref:Zn-ribbon domain-containing OB-fold protein n=1 Tax=Roseovarius indicus TaxID=540747 RepID=UPI0032EC3CC6
MSTTDPRFDGAGPEARWTDLLESGVFAIQTCGACNASQFPPVATCQACGAPEPALVPASGPGTVYATTTVRARDGAYDVSIIELDEGPRIMSRVEGVSAEEVQIGQRVTARVDTGGETPVVVFDRAEERA